MLRRIVLFLYFLFLASPAYAMQGQVVGITDGDTIKVITKNGFERIRLYGVDSPEKAQAYGISAKDFMTVMLKDKVVEISPVGSVSYDRVVAVVMYGTQCVQEQLLLSGYAWVDPKYCTKSFCTAWKSLQGIAMQNKVGLWRDPMPVQPWEWRRQRR